MIGAVVLVGNSVVAHNSFAEDAVINTLNIERFRGFSSYRLNGLNRVNLLVGDNNSGKTSVLEALEIFAGGGYLSPLLRCAMRRGEFNFQSEYGRHFPVDLRHLFYDRVVEPGYGFRIATGEEGDDAVSVRLTEAEVQASLFEPLSEGNWYDQFDERFALEIQGYRTADWKSVPIRELQERFDSRRRSASMGRETERSRFVPIQDNRIDDLGQLWDELVLTSREDYVVNALNIIDPDIERIAFLGDSRRRTPTYAGIVVRRKGSDKRFPIGSMGDGVKRLLSLSLHLASVPNGYLFVDEIDTGLHHSVMQQMWRLLIRAAEDLNIQVFATSHSLDCVRSLARLYDEDGDLGDDVSVHRLEPNMKESVRYSVPELKTAVKHEMEIR